MANITMYLTKLNSCPYCMKDGITLLLFFFCADEVRSRRALPRDMNRPILYEYDYTDPSVLVS